MIFFAMRNLDDLDMRLLYELSMDGSASIPALSKKLGVNPSVLYSRLKRMVKKGIIRRFTIEIDDSLLGVGVRALVGINRDPKLKATIHRDLLSSPEVTSLCEVTGRFDMVIQVVTDDLEKLHRVVIERIGNIDGIQNTETFVELQKVEKGGSYLNPLREQAGPEDHK